MFSITVALVNAVLALYGEPEAERGESLTKLADRLNQLARVKRANNQTHERL